MLRWLAGVQNLGLVPRLQNLDHTLLNDTHQSLPLGWMAVPPSQPGMWHPLIYPQRGTDSQAWLSRPSWALGLPQLGNFKPWNWGFPPHDASPLPDWCAGVLEHLQECLLIKLVPATVRMYLSQLHTHPLDLPFVLPWWLQFHSPIITTKRECPD